MRSLPAPWVTLAERRAIPGSARGIASHAGIAVTTVSRLIFEGRTTPETVQKVAEVLGVSQDHIRKLAGMPTDLGVWVPPEAANSLDHATRSALEDLIRAIANGGTHAGTNAEKRPDAVLGRRTATHLRVTPPSPEPDPQSGSGSQGQGSSPRG